MKTIMINDSGQTPMTKFSYLITVFVVILLFGQYSKSFAQGYTEAVSYSSDFMPMKIADPNGNQTFSGNDFRFSAFAPVFLNNYKSQYLLIGGNFEALHFWGTHPDLDVNGVYSISPTFGYVAALSKSFTLSELLIPLLNSDFNNIKGSDIHFGAIIRGDYLVNSKLAFRVTMGYRYQFYGPQYLALIGNDWKISNKWRFYGDAPSNANLNYKICEKINTGFNLTANNTSYGLDHDRYLKYNTIEPGLYMEYGFCKNWAIRGTAAYSVQRNLEIYNKDDKVDGVVDFINIGTKPTPLNLAVSNGPSFKMAISYRIADQEK